MRVADYIALRLARHGITELFMVTGGGAMHLNDAFGRCPDINVVCFHHEQAAAIAAESYFRRCGCLAAVNVTTGPGGINALNGVFGAYTDSLGMVVISGQVKRQTLARNHNPALRQLGDQEVDIVSMVRPIVKYATVLQDPAKVREVMDKALYLAENGRPGPVWVDVPVDVQSALIDPEALHGFDPALGMTTLRESLLGDPDLTPNTLAELGRLPAPVPQTALDEILRRIANAKRPVLFVGSGVRIAGMERHFLALSERLGIPVVSAFNAHDLLANDHPCYAGRTGTIGDRAGNFAAQNADVLLVLGCRLNIRQISYNWDSFARFAWKAMVEIDPAELAKPTIKIDFPVLADLKDFIPQLLACLEGHRPPLAHQDFLAWCRSRVQRYPVVLPEYWKVESPVNPYCFVDRLFSQLGPDDVVVTGDGTACVVTFHASTLKQGQRLYSNSGCASMGYDLPAALGAYYAGDGGRVVCLAGDGSIMMNLQELQTIAGLGLPVKIFVLNNDGYHSIRQTQNAFFPGNEVGVGPNSGVSFPDFVKLATAFGIPAFRCERHDALDGTIKEALAGNGPTVCEIMLELGQTFSPKLSSRKLADGSMVTSPLEDMAPFLSREELAGNMLVEGYQARE